MDYNAFRELGLSFKGSDGQASQSEKTKEHKDETSLSDFERLADCEKVENDIFENNDFIIKMEDDLNEPQDDDFSDFSEHSLSDVENMDITDYKHIDDMDKAGSKNCITPSKDGLYCCTNVNIKQKVDNS